MEFAPAQWLIQVIALLPAALRPGVLLALVIAMLWFVLIRRGLPDLWRAACRAAAVAVRLLVSVLLLPEYMITTARRSRGRRPGALALAVAPVAQQVLEATSTTYERNLPKTRGKQDPAGTKAKASPTSGTEQVGSRSARRSKFPWLWCGLAIMASAGWWIAMNNLARTDEAKKTFAEAFEYWREVEGWAKVDRSERAAPGEPAAASIESVTYHGYVTKISVSCATTLACFDTVSVRTRRGTALGSHAIELESGEHTVVALRLAHGPRGQMHHLHVDVNPAAS